MRQAARANARRRSGPIDLLQPRVIRPGWNLRNGTHSRYDPFVANGEVDREEWAKVVQELLDRETEIRKHGAKTRFAAKGGKTTRTVDTWLAGQVDVKEANVRSVADAYDLDMMQLLIRVGFYREEQVGRLTPEQIDEERARVLDSDLDDTQKMRILQRLDEMQANDERILQEQRERDKTRRLRELEYLINEARRA